MMITGPNGVGKTAIARVLAGLWEKDGGVVERPHRGVKGVLVVPQRAYMVVGTLLDQIIYPHSYAQFAAAGRTHTDLMTILEGRSPGIPSCPRGWVDNEEGMEGRAEWRRKTADGDGTAILSSP